jgi:hypothetical protein
LYRYSSGDAAAALQQSLQPTWIPKEEEAEGKAAEEYGDEAYDAEGPAGANPGDVDEVEEEPTEVDEAAAGAETDNARRRLLQQRQQQQRKQHKQKPNQQQQQKQQGEQQHKKQKRTPPRVPAMGQRRLLSDQEARQRNLPKGAQLIAQVRKPLPKVRRFGHLLGGQQNLSCFADVVAVVAAVVFLPFNSTHCVCVSLEALRLGTNPSSSRRGAEAG